MRLRRFRFTIGQLMIVVAAVALGFAFPSVSLTLLFIIATVSSFFVLLIASIIALIGLALLITTPFFWLLWLIDSRFDQKTAESLKSQPRSRPL